MKSVKAQKRNSTPFVSVIIPAHKTEMFIEKNLINTKQVLDQTRYEYEIICVIDGKVDRAYEKAKKAAKRYPKQIRVTGYLTNLGKGHAVRFGMARAKGEIVGFIDAGIELNPNGLIMLLEHFEWYDADVIIGSKRHPVSKVAYPWQRKMLSFVYQLIVRILFSLKVKDTQVGMKFFRREVLGKTLPRLLVKAFAFDIEILAVAHSLGFKRIYEAPVELKMSFGGPTTIVQKGFLRTIWNTLWDTLAVFYRLKILHYYDYKNRKNWITPKYLTLNKSK